MMVIRRIKWDGIGKPCLTALLAVFLHANFPPQLLNRGSITWKPEANMKIQGSYAKFPRVAQC